MYPFVCGVVHLFWSRCGLSEQCSFPSCLSVRFSLITGDPNKTTTSYSVGIAKYDNNNIEHLHIKDNDIIMNTIVADSGANMDVITGKQKDTYQRPGMRSAIGTQPSFNCQFREKLTFQSETRFAPLLTTSGRFAFLESHSDNFF